MSLRPSGQPFTFGGVARYAYATPGRLFAVAVLFGLISGGVVATLLTWHWAPVVGEAIKNLPENSAIHDGVLIWSARRPQLLGANAFVSFTVPGNDPRPGAPADFAFVLEPNQLSVHSVSGFASAPYPRGWTMQLNRTALLPIWGAWEQALWPLVTLCAAAGVILSWSALAIPYALIVRVLAGIMNRELIFRQAWKLSVAAQWPGAVLMSFAIALYALDEAALLFVAVAFLAHFALTMVYLFFAPVCLPRAGTNPFSPGKQVSKRSKNPFGEAGD